MGAHWTHPIQLLVRYWEIQPSQMGAYLDDLLEKGVSRVASFVPWQAFESDISHSLLRFLQAAFERDFDVALFIFPEPGVHYPYASFPKDLVVQSEHLARNSNGEEFYAHIPPTAFCLPSPFSPEFSKRY